MLWQNEPTVVVGKHQNTLAEVNLDFIEENNIKIARRLSGGGTVFHDAGNINFTYIIEGEEGKMVDFGKYTKNIAEALNRLGIPAESNKRHDLIIEGKKISGNAEHIFKRRVLHHGTLLFNTDLELLEKAITPKFGKYKDKAVQSIRSKVCNIQPYLEKLMNLEDFKNYLLDFLFQKSSGTEMKTLNSGEFQKVVSLSEQKYSKWEWIFGYSPYYEIKNQMNSQKGMLNIKLAVRKGEIIDSQIDGNMFDMKEIIQINQGMVGLKHQKDVIHSFLEKHFDFKNSKGIDWQSFINHLF